MYGWFLKHKRTGQYVRFDPPSTVTVVAELQAASRYETQNHAFAAIMDIQLLPMMLSHRGGQIELEAVDATIPEPQVPDADQTPVVSRDDLLKAAHEAGAERRARHDAARAEFAAQPSGYIVSHPGFDADAPKGKRHARANKRKGGKP